MRTNTKTAAIWFQSTHSLRSATSLRNRYSGFWQVSIHALLAECDLLLQKSKNILKSFNPRTPCGVRPTKSRRCPRRHGFQSTHSLRSATGQDNAGLHAGHVSIHALLAECDFGYSKAGIALISFNPRTPCGVRPFDCGGGLQRQGFNPRTPCGVRLIYGNVMVPAACFNPRTPCGVRQSSSDKPSCRIWFQSTHSLRSATRVQRICN